MLVFGANTMYMYRVNRSFIIQSAKALKEVHVHIRLIVVKLFLGKFHFTF